MFPLGLAGGRTLVTKENTSVAPALNNRTTSMHTAMFRSGQIAAEKWFQEVIAGAQFWTDDSDKRIGMALWEAWRSSASIIQCSADGARH
jgi:hypothetical protein